jgi:hypothetical protein
MEYTKDEKALLIGRALSLARYEHRRALGKLMDKHPGIFKDIISSILTGEITLDHQIKDCIIKLAKGMGYTQELLDED